MAKVCQVTKTRPLKGHNVSHAHNVTLRRSLPNLRSRRYWVPGEERSISLRLTCKAMRTIDKLGIDAVLAVMRARGDKV